MGWQVDSPARQVHQSEKVSMRSASFSLHSFSDSDVSLYYYYFIIIALILPHRMSKDLAGSSRKRNSSMSTRAPFRCSPLRRPLMPV